MKWGDAFLLAMSFGYLAASVAYLTEGNKGYALALFCYAVANTGLIWAAR